MSNHAVSVFAIYVAATESSPAAINGEPRATAVSSMSNTDAEIQSTVN